jgi:hypothetical protein
MFKNLWYLLTKGPKILRDLTTKLSDQQTHLTGITSAIGILDERIDRLARLSDETQRQVNQLKREFDTVEPPKIDYSQLELSYEDLAKEIDYDSLCYEIDLEKLSNEFNVSDIADEIDLTELGAKIDFDPDDVKVDEDVLDEALKRLSTDTNLLEEITKALSEKIRYYELARSIDNEKLSREITNTINGFGTKVDKCLTEIEAWKPLSLFQEFKKLETQVFKSQNP